MGNNEGHSRYSVYGAGEGAGGRLVHHDVREKVSPQRTEQAGNLAAAVNHAEAQGHRAQRVEGGSRGTGVERERQLRLWYKAVSKSYDWVDEDVN